ncbi:MAG: GAF domain-containing protein [Opitutaceae bacterium]
MLSTLEILRPEHVETTPKEEVFKTLCVNLTEDIQADIVSIWFFDKSQTAIHCQIYYDAKSKTFEKGQILRRSDYPHYFEAIIEEKYISAADAQHQNATRELAEDYLIPHGIQSTLDFVLHEGLRPVGVICCENRVNPRIWSEQDKNILRAIAELISLRFAFQLSA